MPTPGGGPAGNPHADLHPSKGIAKTSFDQPSGSAERARTARAAATPWPLPVRSHQNHVRTCAFSADQAKMRTAEGFCWAAITPRPTSESRRPARLEKGIPLEAHLARWVTFREQRRVHSGER